MARTTCSWCDPDWWRKARQRFQKRDGYRLLPVTSSCVRRCCMSRKSTARRNLVAHGSVDGCRGVGASKWTTPPVRSSSALDGRDTTICPITGRGMATGKSCAGGRMQVRCRGGGRASDEDDSSPLNVKEPSLLSSARAVHGICPPSACWLVKTRRQLRHTTGVRAWAAPARGGVVALSVHPRIFPRCFDRAGRPDWLFVRSIPTNLISRNGSALIGPIQFDRSTRPI